MIKDFETGALRNFNFDDLLRHIPELKLLTCEIDTMSFDAPIDSSNMNPDYWVQIAQMVEAHYDAYDGFVILHGSDTMSYTGAALSFMLENLSKPVVLTGSQLPIGDLRTDAKENLITSIQIASLQENGRPKINEVCLYFEYKLYRANRTTKINAEHFEACASLNYPPLAESGVHLLVFDNVLMAPNKNPLEVHTELVSDIVLIKMFPGINRITIEHILSRPGLREIILETYGSGNVTNSDWFLEALEGAMKKGVPVVNVTQCSGGSVNMGVYETSVGLKKLGVISGKDITTEAALAKLMFLLGQEVSSESLKTLFETSLRGEMS